MAEEHKILRCAIYTRKSTEEGLELQFNSLQAQREACEAYIKSQKHEGWKLVPTEYDDGGYSGGNLNRPALQRLLKDIADGLIDIIVVYKIDRLTRSLHDFSKIVDVLEERNASFVSITQHFNTSSSMGRLTLNMLLSFAQFEREITGERLRDKIAASKKKGMWMGGTPPMGYKRKDKKLYPDEPQSAKIQLIFDKYNELKSVQRLKKYLDSQHIYSQHDIPLSVGNLYRILQNRAYIGEVPHKGVWYKGEHKGIIEIGVFHKAQDTLQEHRIDRQRYEPQKSLLCGKLYDDKGNRMSPCWSTGSKGKKYRYYVSQAVIKCKSDKIGKVSKISLPEIETFIDKWFNTQFKEDKSVFANLLKSYSVNDTKQILNSIQNKTIDQETQRILLGRVDLLPEEITLTIYQEQLCEYIRSLYENRPIKELFMESLKTSLVFHVKYHIAVIDNGAKAIVGERIEKNTNKTLVQLLIQAFNISHDILQGKQIEDLCEKYQLTDRYMRKILTLRFLPAKVILSILDGTQGREITAKQLFEQASQHK